MMSDNEFDELYQKGDMIWVDPDGRERIPAHEYASLTERVEMLEGDYYELLWAVCKKYDGETRHETALRYIQEAERGSGDASVILDALLESE